MTRAIRKERRNPKAGRPAHRTAKPRMDHSLRVSPHPQFVISQAVRARLGIPDEMASEGHDDGLGAVA